MCYSIMVEQDLKILEREFGAKPDLEAFTAFTTRAAAEPKRFHPLVARIYPNYWAPVITAGAGPKSERVASPMRYRVRPSWSPDEIPSKYNLFNARLDALESRRTWKQLFMKRHGLLVFQCFFEWVEDEATGKKKVLAFRPEGRTHMWAPVLYDCWRSADGQEELRSFAVITTDPPPEIAACGHDRCPVFIKAKHIEAWLHPEGRSKADVYKMLHDLEPATFFAAAA